MVAKNCHHKTKQPQNMDCTKHNTPNPKHIAIIMDGNGRWAKKQNKPRIEGHKAGAETVRNILKSIQQLNIKYLTLYAFSTENWKRPTSEIGGLMELLQIFLKNYTDELNQNNIKLNVIGQLQKLPIPVRLSLNKTIKLTANNTTATLTLALSYGARNEITNAVQNIAKQIKNNKLKITEINEELISKHLYTANIPDPELIIRTAGEMRLSNFLLWQASYAEFYSTKTLWPDFNHQDLLLAIKNYSQRTRRFGGLPNAN